MKRHYEKPHHLRYHLHPGSESPVFRPAVFPATSGVTALPGSLLLRRYTATGYEVTFGVRRP